MKAQLKLNQNTISQIKLPSHQLATGIGILLFYMKKLQVV